MKSKSMAAVVGNKNHKASPSQETRRQLANVPSQEEIRLRAYEIHIERGGTQGRDLDDWLQAERELVEKFKAG